MDTHDDRLKTMLELWQEQHQDPPAREWCEDEPFLGMTLAEQERSLAQTLAWLDAHALPPPPSRAQRLRQHWNSLWRQVAPWGLPMAIGLLLVVGFVSVIVVGQWVLEHVSFSIPAFAPMDDGLFSPFSAQIAATQSMMRVVAYASMALGLGIAAAGYLTGGLVLGMGGFILLFLLRFLTLP